ncbi:MAG TPA: hypothetical protein GX392_04975, partial [Clostridiales bacterium]|nr:hypothetical protein [Clostridiales bacterium]
KENVIIGKQIPAGTGMPQYKNISITVEGQDDQYKQENTDEVPKAE